MRARTSTLAASLAVVLLGLAFVASGCGSSPSSEEDVAALDDTTADETTTDTTEEDDAATDPQEDALKWARCMREHGVEVPDPDFSGGQGTVRIRVRGRGGDFGDAKFRAAEKACGRPFRGSGPPLSEEKREELQEAMLAYAKCMREHGIDMPDPQFGEGGGMIVRRGPGGNGPDLDSEEFGDADKACRPILRETEEKLGLGKPGS
jgi:hypothetical protein